MSRIRTVAHRLTCCSPSGLRAAFDNRELQFSLPQLAFYRFDVRLRIGTVSAPHQDAPRAHPFSFNCPEMERKKARRLKALPSLRLTRDDLVQRDRQRLRVFVDQSLERMLISCSRSSCKPARPTDRLPCQRSDVPYFFVARLASPSFGAPRTALIDPDCGGNGTHRSDRLNPGSPNFRADRGGVCDNVPHQETPPVKRTPTLALKLCGSLGREARP